MGFDLTLEAVGLGCLLLVVFLPPLAFLCLLPGVAVAVYVGSLLPVESLGVAVLSGVMVSAIPLIWSLGGSFYQTLFLKREEEVFQFALPLLSLLYLSQKLFDGTLLQWIPPFEGGGDPTALLLTALQVVSGSVQWVTLFGLVSSIVLFCWSSISQISCSRDSGNATTVYYSGLIPIAIFLVAISFESASGFLLETLLSTSGVS